MLRGRNIYSTKPVTYCYNLIEEKACFGSIMIRILRCMGNDKNKGKTK